MPVAYILAELINNYLENEKKRLQT